MSETNTDTTQKSKHDNKQEIRLIKKYPNRRLYDTAISSYITLEDVKRLVMEQVAIQVIDARSSADITHSTLLQIILDQEESGPPLFTTDLLQKMIRFYGDSMQTMFGKMFEQGMQFFSEQQHALQSQSSQYATQAEKPMNMLSEFTKNNIDQWQQLQQMWLQNFQDWAKTMQPTQTETNQESVSDNAEYFVK